VEVIKTVAGLPKGRHGGIIMEMQSGSLWKNIFKFSVPLMFSNLLQIFFNLSDVAVAGKFAGPIALGAVGSTSILISLTTGILIGMSSGANALTALYIGSGDTVREKKCVQCAFLVCLGTGIAVLLLGEFFSHPVLRMIKTKEELMQDALLYFRIYLLGSPALALYNYGNGILSAAGDTKKPLKYLAISGVLNIALNLFFVIVLKLGAVGVALASAVAQYVSAALVLRALIISKDHFRLVLSEIRLDRKMAAKLLNIGIPSAIQYSLFAVANLFVQTAVNSFDHITVEGNSAAANADTIVYEMMAAFYTACTSFIAQNFGAGKKDRVLKTYGITTLYSFGTGLLLGVLIFIFRENFLSLFTSEREVVEAGLARISIMSLSYCVSAFMDNASAAARGLGKAVVPTVIVIMGSVVFRIVWIYTVFAYFHTLSSLYLLYVCAWTVTAIAGNIYFFKEYRKIGSGSGTCCQKTESSL